MSGTLFSEVYNCFLGKITDDLYIELTPEDTIKDLRKMLINAIPAFEFPRKNLYSYEIKTEVVDSSEVTEYDFVIGVVWDTIPEPTGTELPQRSIIERSSFEEKITPEEINILACLMLNIWLERQVNSIEVTRMKYSGTDFKLSSQANQLSKLLTSLETARYNSKRLQRLYKRRVLDENGKYISNWFIFGSKGAQQ